VSGHQILVDDSHHAGARIFNVGNHVALELDSGRIKVLPE